MMLSVSEAVAAVLQATSPFIPQPITLADSLGLVLAEDVRSDRDSPPFDKSLVDGFAVRIADCKQLLPVIEMVAAGQVPARAINEPAAIQVMTGAPMPIGAEAVVPVELTKTHRDSSDRLMVMFLSDISPWKSGSNIVRQGSSYRSGEVIVAAGAELRPQELGALAELGRATISAHRRPRVAVLATGDELVPIDQTPGPGQIRNSNEMMLCAQIRRAGAVAIPLGIARDERSDLRKHIEAGLQGDVLVLSGGVSMGDLDLVPSELSAAGVRQVFHKVNVKPGKPVWFGVGRTSGVTPPDPPFGRGGNENAHCLVFGLPGNPVSSLVCFELFVRPALRRLMGVEPAEPRAVSARLMAAHTTKGDRPTYQPARLEWTTDGPIVTAVPWVGSSDLRATVAANAMALFPIGNQTYSPGRVVEVIAW